MESEDKQRISLYLDKETVIKMDEAIKKYDYRSRTDFVSFAVNNLIADNLADRKKYVPLCCGNGTHHADVFGNYRLYSERN